MNLCEGKDSFERIISLLESLSAVPTPKALIYDDWFFRVLYRQEERFFQKRLIEFIQKLAKRSTLTHMGDSGPPIRPPPFLPP